MRGAGGAGRAVLGGVGVWDLSANCRHCRYPPGKGRFCGSCGHRPKMGKADCDCTPCVDRRRPTPDDPDPYSVGPVPEHYPSVVDPAKPRRPWE